MRVGIVGAGSIAYGTAALVEQQGHKVTLWSPSGERTKALAAGEALVADGAIKGTFHPAVAASAAKLVAGADVLVVALPAYGHKTVLDAIAPYVASQQTVVFSSHASFGALYLSRLLAARGVVATIVAWGTTAVTGRQQGPTSVNVNTVRKQVDLATVPAARSAAGLAVCKELFGDRFLDRGSLMAIALSNLNPQNHMGIALGNMTRMERGESWSQGQNVTPNVGRLLEDLDQERIAIATKLGLDVRNIFQHFHLSFHVPISSISRMNQEMHEAGNGGSGPATADSRYVTEDVPFGLVMTAKIGRLAGYPAELHEAGVRIFSAMYGRDFTAENDLLSALELDAMSLEELKDLCHNGFPAAAA
ncbi:NAD/NADP octopine/nopaline dehydrogenase [Rhizobium sp. Root73]|uniref:NAD/NADP octopine/nopaline dehydrogenase family protein n=1 Tax=unclassified Rhizobium TaxID=2613769 RepID=UPI00072ADB0D|nr:MULTISPECIES: NAD/NADP octopine/nopaline dehydrogenase family protein [unclassified Rhizobium]KQY16794.1 NAD/NADP octopine/nopaline dehydrogenase [Rhizobium sp. Root1334]KRC11355.1 NAD/NADP octopine/nopaline dehydrogenase [Rhizobium sp. Root73]